jgi:hypothetical protein
VCSLKIFKYKFLKKKLMEQKSYDVAENEMTQDFTPQNKIGQLSIAWLSEQVLHPARPRLYS